MQGLFSPPQFAGFGSTRLYPTSPLQQVSAARTRELRTLIRRQCSLRPGVYGMLDSDGQMVYVGKAKRLRARLLSYFRSKGRDPKARRILLNVRSIVWEVAPSEFAALLRELELIHRFEPRFNVQGQPRRRRRTYVCLGQSPAPYLYLTRKPGRTAEAVFGPVLSSRVTAEAVRRLNDHFQLRDCPQRQTMVFADQARLFEEPLAAGCLRLEIGTCLGPCAAACTSRAYNERARAALAFLRGDDRSLLQRLQTAMAAASSQQSFEQAGAIRDQVKVLGWLCHQLRRLEEARAGQCFVYDVEGHDGKSLWYLIHEGRIVASVAAPRRPTQWRALERKIGSLQRRALPSPKEFAPEDLDGVFLIAAWFRKFPHELRKTLTYEHALARCREQKSPTTNH